MNSKHRKYYIDGVAYISSLFNEIYSKYTICHNKFCCISIMEAHTLFISQVPFIYKLFVWHILLAHFH